MRRRVIAVSGRADQSPWSRPVYNPTPMGMEDGTGSPPDLRLLDPVDIRGEVIVGDGATFFAAAEAADRGKGNGDTLPKQVRVDPDPRSDSLADLADAERDRAHLLARLGPHDSSRVVRGVDLPSQCVRQRG